MSLPSGLLEELALERLAVSVLEEEASRFWHQGAYGAAREAQAEARAAREHLAELEAQMTMTTQGGDHDEAV